MKDQYTLEDLRNWEQATKDLSKPARLAVIGDPVLHSRSPAMHQAALDELGKEISYVRIHLLAEELEEAFALFREKGFLGFNVTIPHKADALKLVDEVDPHAAKMQAVNTVLVEDGKLIGYSTDGPGLVRAIRQEFSMDLRDLRVLVLGAGGGAGRSISVQCALEGVERLVLCNRTEEKSKVLAKELRTYFSGARLAGPTERLEAIPWENARIEEVLHYVDLVINATSVGMQRSDPPLLPESLLHPSLMVYDTVYSRGRTRLVSAAESVGARAANGLSMLLHQGALSLEIWLDSPAPLDAMRAGLNSVAE